MELKTHQEIYQVPDITISLIEIIDFELIDEFSKILITDINTVVFALMIVPEKMKGGHFFNERILFRPRKKELFIGVCLLNYELLINTNSKKEIKQCYLESFLYGLNKSKELFPKLEESIGLITAVVNKCISAPVNIPDKYKQYIEGLSE